MISMSFTYSQTKWLEGEIHKIFGESRYERRFRYQDIFRHHAENSNHDIKSVMQLTRRMKKLFTFEIFSGF